MACGADPVLVDVDEALAALADEDAVPLGADSVVSLALTAAPEMGLALTPVLFLQLALYSAVVNIVEVKVMSAHYRRTSQQEGAQRWPRIPTLYSPPLGSPLVTT